MRRFTPARTTTLIGGLLAVVLLEGFYQLQGNPFSWVGLLSRLLFVAVVIAFGALILPRQRNRRSVWALLPSLVLGTLALLVYLVWPGTVVAWIGIVAWYAFLLRLDWFLFGSTGRLVRLLGLLGLAAIGGLVPVALEQIDIRFADEEFFAAVRALALAAFSIVVLLSGRSLWMPAAQTQPPNGSIRTPRIVATLAVTAGVVAVLLLAGNVYQQSFYPQSAPSYPGITAAQPFLCGPAPAEAQTYDGQEVFRRLLARVAANPMRGTSEYGMLALGTHEQQWAQQFRSSLLDDAAQGRFTEPANSVKAGQSQASMRAYYYGQVHQAFPGLFSAEEDQRIHAWFAAINQRALTVEWVDWLYALAFDMRPEGPYENQESGAGLLANLELNDLSAPELAATNRDYLARHQRGWLTRFRNNDDALLYQPEWLMNAMFQEHYNGQRNDLNKRLGFEWLLLQALPNAAPTGNNHPIDISNAGVAYLGASLLNDPQLLWLAGRGVDWLEANNQPLFALPGVERPLALTGTAPAIGSCLMYGDTGLPTQLGPLGPDKIVLRDGWAADDLLAALNVRFTGWHRYKATNTLSRLYQDGPLVIEKVSGQPFAWLPYGRSLFRDKRIPRENLNGLSISRVGLSAVLYTLTGVGGPWSQDPPYFARVSNFATGEQRDSSTTVIDDWHSWRQERTVTLQHDGPLVVIDHASGPTTQDAALFWHAPGQVTIDGDRIQLRSEEHPAELLVITPQPEQHLTTEVVGEPGTSASLKISGNVPGQLHAISVFLTGDWVGSTARLVETADGPGLEIVNGVRSTTIPIGDDDHGQ